MLIQNTSNMAPMTAVPVGNGGATGVAVQAPAPQAATAEQPAVQQPQQPSHAQLLNEIGKINAALQRSNKAVELSISTDEATRKQVVKLTDKDSGETLIQYPSDAVLAIARGIDEFQQGLLLKQQA